MNDRITIMNLSFGTVAIFEDVELLPANGEFEFDGQRYKAKEILMTGAVRPSRKESLSWLKGFDSTAARFIPRRAIYDAALWGCYGEFEKVAAIAREAEASRDNRRGGPRYGDDGAFVRIAGLVIVTAGRLGLRWALPRPAKGALPLWKPCQGT